MNNSTIGIIIEHGTVVRAVTNNEDLCPVSVVIVEEGVATKLIRPGLEDEITHYVQEAREQNLLYFFGTAAEVAGDALIELSKRPCSDPVKLLTEIEGVMAALYDAIHESLRR